MPEQLHELNQTLKNLSEVLYRLDERVKGLLDRQSELILADVQIAKTQYELGARLVILENHVNQTSTSITRVLDVIYKVSSGLVLAYLCWKFGLPR